MSTKDFQDYYMARLQTFDGHPFPSRFNNLFLKAVFLADYLPNPSLGIRQLCEKGFRSLDDISEDVQPDESFAQ